MSDLQQAINDAHFHAMRCHYHLRNRIDDDAPISVQTLSHEDGGWSSEAFHTPHRKYDADTATSPFVREVVSYNRYAPHSRDEYVHAVQYYPEGHHEDYYTYVLCTFTSE